MGTKIKDSAIRSFVGAITECIPHKRIIRDPLRTLAFGTDASFYRLIPRVVIKTENETEVQIVLKTASELRMPVTFRAAGTSLSGQSVSDSILLVAGHNWNDYSILDNGARIRLQPGVIGGRANQYLAPYGMKIGPDPASINAAMIGGIAANNASGMCCGTAQNSYQTVDSMRIIFSDGTLLDTSDESSRQSFKAGHGSLLERVKDLAVRVKDNKTLAHRIRHKFKIKNTTGYSLNALVDFSDPFDIIAHLMIGSEGTLGFISQIVYRTVVEHAHKASALMVFENIEEACRSVYRLKQTPVQAVELMDRAALRSVESKSGMPGVLKSLPPDAAALLVETRGASREELKGNVTAIETILESVPLPHGEKRNVSGLSGFTPVQCPTTILPIQFTDVAEEYTGLWNIRKGLFPAVGAVRRIGTTVIIEDVAFPLDSLAPATLALQSLFKKHLYHEAIIFGHALEGNLHFVFTQDFGRSSEVERYRTFMDDVCHMVVEEYDGSLKAEHGTGRNMAPYVEMEWGREAYQLMREIKQIFDPENILNPGVILSDNALTHVQNLKPLPPAHDILDKCIECGFCEAVCPSRELTLTPRQRIAIQREISRLKTTCENPDRLKNLENRYRYQGEETCAADGLCAESCPVEIDTGKHTKFLRSIPALVPWRQKTADWIAKHYKTAAALTSMGLRMAHAGHRLLGTKKMAGLTRILREWSGDRIPLWNPYLPKGIYPQNPESIITGKSRQVVYLPSCINRVMGPAMGDPDQVPLVQVVMMVLRRAGFDVILPPGQKVFCCGTPFESKGFFRQAEYKAEEMNGMLLAITRNGRLPVLCDTGPCVYHLRGSLDSKIEIYEPMEFIQRFLLDLLTVTPSRHAVALHITCSSRKMGLETVFHDVAAELAHEAIFPDDIQCCGWAGDRGFNFPELTASALAPLKQALRGRCTAGYSNSRTCEIGLSQHSGIYYKSIFYLLDRCSRLK